MFEFILCLSIGILIGLVAGFPIGFLATKKSYTEEIFDVGFTAGFQFGKDSFYNPQAKG